MTKRAVEYAHSNRPGGPGGLGKVEKFLDTSAGSVKIVGLSRKKIPGSSLTIRLGNLCGCSVDLG